MLKQIICWILYLIFHLSINAQIIPKNKDLTKIRIEIQNLVRESIIPSMAVAVVKDGEILWQEAIGYANVAVKKSANINSIYPLGSVSKSITATGIMQMINADKLNLSQDIRPLLHPIEIKDIKGNAPEIKLWQLVTMNSGINHGYGVFDDKKNLPSSIKDKKRFFEETTIVAFKPGTVYEYSNRAFYLSELIIENVSKMSFQEFMNKNVFFPLKMKSTIAYPYQNLNNQNFVTTYSSKNLKELETNISYPAGGSGLWSSISDMTKYAMFHLGVIKNDSVLNSNNLKLMHNFRQGPADLFGIGWFNSGGDLYSNGNVSGGNAAISIDKQNELAIVCLVNKTSWDGIADQYVKKIKNTLVEETNTNDFQNWQRIYGTPYASRYELNGTWKGIIKQPLTNKEISIELKFDKNNKIELKIDNEHVQVNNPTYNLFNELESQFNHILPTIYNEKTRCGLKLKKTGNKLSGYIQFDHSAENRYYRLPLFVELVKHL